VELLSGISEIFQVDVNHVVGEDYDYSFLDSKNRFSCVIYRVIAKNSNLAKYDYQFEVYLNTYATNIMQRRIEFGHEVFEKFKATNKYALLLVNTLANFTVSGCNRVRSNTFSE